MKSTASAFIGLWVISMLIVAWLSIQLVSARMQTQLDIVKTFSLNEGGN